VRSGTPLEQLDYDLAAYWSLTEADLKALAAAMQGSPGDMFALMAIKPWPVLGTIEPFVSALAFLRTRSVNISEEELRRRLERLFAGLQTFPILHDQDGQLPEPIREAKAFTRTQIHARRKNPRVQRAPLRPVFRRFSQ
jgi:hypothetical protein